MSRARLAETGILLGVSIAGLAAFVLPLTASRTFRSEPTALLTGLICGALAVLLALGLQAHHLPTRALAVLAALAAVDATLRALIVIGVFGFTPIFLLVLTGGFVFGPGFGFALGALTMLLSAIITAGVGPWLPYEMLGAGFVGLSAGLLGPVFNARPTSRKAVLALAGLGLLMGFAYGMLLDLWDWPLLLANPGSAIGWAPGLGLAHLAARFAGFYLTTSAAYDAFRAAGNGVLVLVLGPALLHALHRFKVRFLVRWEEFGPAATMVEHERGRAPAAAGRP